MTAHQKAVALLMQHGPMNSHEFARAMWPTRAKRESPTILYIDAGRFLTEMKKRGLVRRNGQREYYVRRMP